MTDEIWKQEDMASPCVKICVVHPESGICVGCYRTMDEIAGWSGMSDAERADLTANLPDRAPLLKKRRGGRAARASRQG